MSITDEIHFDKEGKPVRFPGLQKYHLPLTLVLLATLSFGLGRLSAGGKREPVRIEYDPTLSAAVEPSITRTEAPTQPKVPTASAATTVNDTTVIGSSKGTKYHYSYCPGAKQISEKNKIVFASPAAAEAAGYTLAGNCNPR